MLGQQGEEGKSGRMVDIRYDIRCGLLSAKGGLMMGTKKVGAFSSPRKKAKVIITRKKPM